MKKILQLSCLVLASSGLLSGSVFAAAAKQAASPARKNGVNFEQTKARIDALLKQRLQPVPLPETLPNPFQITDATPPATVDAAPSTVLAPLEPASDEDRLLQYAANLKISGLVRLNGVTHLIINQAPYKEGDSITVGSKEEGPFLQIVRVAPGELTLKLNQTERTLKFKM